MARSGADRALYERQLKTWYSDPNFSNFRTQLMLLFAWSVPLFSISLSLLPLLALPFPYSLVSSCCFAVTGAFLSAYLHWLLDLFRVGVLGLSRGSVDSASVEFAARRSGGEGRGGEEKADEGAEEEAEDNEEEGALRSSTLRVVRFSSVSSPDGVYSSTPFKKKDKKKKKKTEKTGGRGSLAGGIRKLVWNKNSKKVALKEE